jgi:long-chain acyl-CoA synthetase
MHYGLTEASRSCFLCFANDNLYLDSVGKASPMAKIGIFSKNGEMLPPNIVGEIGVKGAFVTQNVIADLPTHLFFYGDYYRTGDLGYLNHQGYLFLTGRIADVINVGGKKVVPSEVESVLKMNPSIAEVYCAGIPDPEGLSGEIVLAFAQANDPLFTPEISYFLESLIENLEHHKIPKKIIWVNEFPMTENGKIKRNLLKSLT